MNIFSAKYNVHSDYKNSCIFSNANKITSIVQKNKKIQINYAIHQFTEIYQMQLATIIINLGIARRKTKYRHK